MKRSDSDEPSSAALEASLNPLLGQRLALCVSGGADSMAMMHLVAQWSRRPQVRAAWHVLERQRRELRRRSRSSEPAPMPPVLAVDAAWMRETHPEPDGSGEKLEWPAVVVLTVDHGLRPESAGEAAFVADEAAKLGLPHQTLVWSGIKPQTGVPRAAREARYRLLFEAIEAECWAWRQAGDRVLGALDADEDLAAREIVGGGRRTLVTAHHREDQAETFLMRLARGTTLDGLTAMRPLETFWSPPRAGRSYRTSHKVARPLLAVPRAALRSYLEARGLTWREDPSNQDSAYERVRIRSALPVLAGLGIAAEEIGMAATRLALVRDNVRSRLADDVQGVLVGDGRGVFGRLRAERLRGKPLDAVMRVVRVALAAYAGEATPPEYRQLLDLSERLCGGAGIAKLTLGGCVLAPPPARMALPATDVLIWRETGRLSTDGVPLAAGHFIDWDGGRFKVAASAEAAGAVMVRPLGRPGWQDLRRRVASLRLHQFPTGAAETLPAIWDAAGLVAVPALVGAGPGQPPLDPSALQDWESALGPRWRHYNATFTGDAVALEAMGAGRGGP